MNSFLSFFRYSCSLYNFPFVLAVQTECVPATVSSSQFRALIPNLRNSRFGARILQKCEWKSGRLLMPSTFPTLARPALCSEVPFPGVMFLEQWSGRDGRGMAKPLLQMHSQCPGYSLLMTVSSILILYLPYSMYSISQSFLKNYYYLTDFFFVCL